jgi:hypothetical protein
VVEGLRALMKKIVGLGYFKGFNVDNSNVGVSYLQYANDTLFICDACVKKNWTIKTVLRWPFFLSDGGGFCRE